jgi:hypothetical protein
VAVAGHEEAPEVLSPLREADPYRYPGLVGRSHAVVEDPDPPVAGDQVGPVVLDADPQRLAQPARAPAQIPLGQGMDLTP